MSELAPDAKLDDRVADRAMRPATLADYTGQAILREQLAIFIQAARRRGEPLDHVLLFGPPGLGKTTMAQVIANEMGATIRMTSGPVLERPGDVAALLTSLSAGDVLFIDEIHRMPATLEEILYSAMEDCKLDIMIGEGAEARSIRIDLPPFTLIGATTRAGSLSAPLRDRFGIIGRLEYYTPAELQQIVIRSAQILGAEITEHGAHEIACRARGTPRIANRLLRRVRDFADAKDDVAPGIHHDTACRALALLGVDQAGMDSTDRRYLTAIIEFYGGGPVGIETVAAATGESVDTLEDSVEPYLIQQGYLQRTPRGRVVTEVARTHLGQERVA